VSHLTTLASTPSIGGVEEMKFVSRQREKNALALR
jgi:hypothetical protein